MQTRRLRRMASNTRPAFNRQSSLASEFSTTSTCSSANRSKDYESLTGAVRTIIHSEDRSPNLLPKFYDGILVDSLATLISSFIYFYIYTNLNKLNIRYKKQTRRKIGMLEAVVEEILIGSLTGIVSKFFTCPLNNITIRLQTCSPSTLSRSRSSQHSRQNDHQQPDANQPTAKTHSGNSPHKPPSRLLLHDSSSSDEDEDDDSSGAETPYLRYLVNTVRSIYDDRGYRGFWSGFGNNCILTLNPSLTLYLTKLLKHLTTRTRSPGPEGLLGTFLTSAIASSLSTMLTYPLMLAKTLAQTSQPSARHSSRQRQLSLAARWRHYGPAALYTGLQTKLLKVFIGQGITMSIKNQIETLFVALWILLQHHRRRRLPL